MKRSLCLIALLCLSLFACKQQKNAATQPGQSAGQQKNQTQKELALPPPEGRAFVTYVSRENPYERWALWPGKGRMYPGTRPHGAFLTTYVNRPALQAIQKKPGQMPDGAIIVKENYTPDKKLAVVTARYKVKGFNPDGGDWYWIKFTPAGQIQAQGKVVSCISCHRKAPGHDFLYTGDVAKQQS